MALSLPSLETLGRTLREVAPGVAIALTIAAAATFLSDHYGAPVMLFALLIGMAFHFLSFEGRCAPGIAFSSRTVLRAGVALLGVRITFADISDLGVQSVLIVVGLIAITIGTGFVSAFFFGRKWRFALLTSGSVAICGASAALALAAIIPPNDKLERNTLFTVVAVTTLSTIAMIAYPILFAWLGMDDRQSGFLIGATIHDVAQVVGAGYSVSNEAGEIATIVKLLRVALLPVLLLIVIAILSSTARPGARPSVPSFVVAFAAIVAVNSFGLIPQPVVSLLTGTSRWMLVTAIAALGMKTTLKAMSEVGGGHIGIIVVETLVLLSIAVIAVMWLGVI